VKLTLKLILVLSLFSSIAFAEGEMGNGGNGEMTGGGKTCPQNQQTCASASEQSGGGSNQTDFILTLIRTYLGSILG
jgi:hypothetical protein